MKKILIITRHYLDQNNGGSNGSKGFIKAFSSIYENCTLIYPEHNNVKSSMFIPSNIIRVPVYDHRVKIIKALDFYRGRMLRFGNFVKSFVIGKQFDIIVIDHSLTASEIINTLKKTGASIITIHHNVEAQYLKDNRPNILWRWPFVYFSKKAEKDALILSDINLTVTQADADIFKSWYPKRNLNLYNLGNFEYADPQLKHFDMRNMEHSFIISGSLYFQQSTKPILEFLTVYYPLLIKKYPDSKLTICGRNPNQKIKKLCRKIKNVVLIPNPENIEAIVRQSNVYVSPINTGSGRKLRIMDGLKLGMPILCHDVSALGYENIKEAGYMFTYRDPKSFIESLDNLINSYINPNDVYSKYLEYFSLSAGIERLKAILEENKLL